MISSTLVNQYNPTLGSLLDVHAPLKTTTITLSPTASWYTDEIRFEKRTRRALERRWRSSKTDCDYLRFREQWLKVNDLINKLKLIIIHISLVVAVATHECSLVQ